MRMIMREIRITNLNAMGQYSQQYRGKQKDKQWQKLIIKNSRRGWENDTLRSD